FFFMRLHPSYIRVLPTYLFLIYLNCLSSFLHPPFFFSNDTATSEIYPLSLHDALPICGGSLRFFLVGRRIVTGVAASSCAARGGDRKSTRLNSSHVSISYAVFCLKKKNN